MIGIHFHSIRWMHIGGSAPWAQDQYEISKKFLEVGCSRRMHGLGENGNAKWLCTQVSQHIQARTGLGWLTTNDRLMLVMRAPSSLNISIVFATQIGCMCTSSLDIILFFPKIFAFLVLDSGHIVRINFSLALSSTLRTRISSNNVFLT